MGTSFSATLVMLWMPSDHDREDAGDEQRAHGRDGGGHVGDDGVGLDRTADAEGGEECQDGEDDAEPLHVEPAVEGVHGAADHIAFFSFDAVFDRDDGLGVFGGHAEETGDPHPEDRAGSAERDGRADADDVAGTDGRGQRGGQGAELRDVARGTLIRSDRQFDGFEDIFLDKSGPDGHEDMCSEQNDDEGPAPQEVRNSGDCVCKHGKSTFRKDMFHITFNNCNSLPYFTALQ